MIKHVDFLSCFKDVTGGNHKVPKGDYLEDGATPIVDQGKQLIGGYSDLENIVTRSGEVIVFGDHTGIVKYIDFDFILGADGVKVIEPNYNLVHPKYGFYALSNVVLPDTGYDRKYKYLKRVTIPLPPLEDQKRIASILDAADAYRVKTKALIEKYNMLSKSLFLEMFGDPVLNPMGWEKVKLGELCEFENGDRSSNYPSGSDILQTGKLFLSSGDIKDGGFIVKDSKFISSEKYMSLKRGKCRRGDILMTLRGNGTGKSGVFNCIYSEGFINAQMVIIRPDSRCSSYYLVKQLNYPSVFKRLILLNSGSAQPQLSATTLKQFEVSIPPLALQNQFAQRIEAIESQKAQAEESLTRAEELFGSLLQRAFRGEL